MFRQLSILDNPFFSLVHNRENSELERLVGLIITTDAILLASAGSIGSMVLSHIARTEEKGYRVIVFISLALMTLLVSVIANMVQVSASTIVFSLIFLFAGVVELLAMLVYSLGLGS